jgi:hypothetical protein
MFFNFPFSYLTVNLFQVEFNDDGNNLRRQSVDSRSSSPERFSSSHQGGKTSSSESDLEERPEVITRDAAPEAALDGRNFRLLSPIRSDPSASCRASSLSPASSSSLSADSGGSAGVDVRLTKRRRGRPSKKVAHRDVPAEDPISRGGGPHEEPPPPPIPILKLRIPKALFQNAGEETVSRSAYRRVAVRKGERRRPSPWRSGVQNRLAQQLRALQPANCKVDVQKFRFKVGRLC